MKHKPRQRNVVVVVVEDIVNVVVVVDGGAVVATTRSMPFQGSFNFPKILHIKKITGHR